MQNAIKPSCRCTAPIMLRAGLVVCAQCNAPIVTGAETYYSSERRDLYPPGRYDADDRKARRQARERIKSHPAHERSGTGKSTEWRVPVDAFHAAPIAPVVKLVPTVTDDDAIALAALGASGLRTTRRAS